MNKLCNDIHLLLLNYLNVRSCLRLECALHKKLKDKEYYVKRFEQEPIENTFRFFRKGKLRTYNVYTYVKEGITWSEVNVSPICRSFICKHRNKISTTKGNQWMLMCLSADADKDAFATMKPMLVTI